MQQSTYYFPLAFLREQSHPGWRWHCFWGPGLLAMKSQQKKTLQTFSASAGRWPWMLHWHWQKTWSSGVYTSLMLQARCHLLVPIATKTPRPFCCKRRLWEGAGVHRCGWWTRLKTGGGWAEYNFRGEMYNTAVGGQDIRACWSSTLSLHLPQRQIWRQVLFSHPLWDFFSW